MVRRFFNVAAWLLAIVLALVPAAGAQLTAPAASPLPAQPEMAQIAAEAQGWLADLVRMNTTNPPGNELEAAKYIAAVLQKENISAEVIEIAPGRGVAIGRLQAGPLPDPSRALLLVGHLDVAPVDKAKWSVDPFGAVVKDGYMYGRGTLQDKGMVAANLATMVALKRSGARLTRDVIFLADDEEEQFGGPAGIKVLVDKYWDKIACAFAINEGGRVTLQNGKVQSVAIQTSEKVPVNVAVIATGTSGHGSLPRADNALVHLAAAIEKIGAMETTIQPNTVVRRYFEQLVQVQDEETAKWMRALETERLDLAARRLADMNPAWNAMLRDSIVPTDLKAGAGPNMVPGEARANLNIRLLPGNSVDPLIAQMQKLVNDPQIRFQVEPGPGPSAPPSSLTSELYQQIERTSSHQFPGAIAVPLLSARATDLAELRLHNVQAYGLLPFPLTDADELRMYSDDERIPLASFRTGVEFLYRMVHEFTAAK